MSEAEEQLRDFIERAIEKSRSPKGLKERIEDMRKRINKEKDKEKQKYGL